MPTVYVDDSENLKRVKLGSPDMRTVLYLSICMIFITSKILNGGYLSIMARYELR